MDIRQTITQLYRDYERKDFDSILAALPDDFTFEFSFEPSTHKFAGICRGKGELIAHLHDVRNSFQFTAYHATNILVDGDRAAAEVAVEVTPAANDRSFSTTIAHFWTFQDGIPVRLVEYMDTALVARKSAPAGPHRPG